MDSDYWDLILKAIAAYFMFIGALLTVGAIGVVYLVYYLIAHVN